MAVLTHFVTALLTSLALARLDKRDLTSQLSNHALDADLLLNDYGEVTETQSNTDIVDRLVGDDNQHLVDYEHVVPYLLGSNGKNQKTLDDKTKRIGGSGAYQGRGELSGTIVTNIPAQQVRLDTYV